MGGNFVGESDVCGQVLDARVGESCRLGGLFCVSAKATVCDWPTGFRCCVSCLVRAIVVPPTPKAKEGRNGLELEHGGVGSSCTCARAHKR